MLERAKWKRTSQIPLPTYLLAAVKNRLLLAVEKEARRNQEAHLQPTTPEPDSGHRSLRATRPPRLSPNRPHPKLCRRSFWIQDVPTASQTCSGAEDRQTTMGHWNCSFSTHWRFWNYIWAQCWRQTQGNVCTGNMDRWGRFSSTHLTVKGFPLNAHMYKSRDACWLWGFRWAVGRWQSLCNPSYSLASTWSRSYIPHVCHCCGSARAGSTQI